MRISLYLFIIVFSLSSCLKLPTGKVRRNVEKTLAEQVLLSNSFVGFHLEDLTTGAVLYSQNSDKYFTPASNTKLLTFYTALQILGDSIPRFKFHETQDTIWFSPTGDPTFLHPWFEDENKLEFFQKEKVYILVEPIFSTPKHGSGWSWDDLDYAFAREKSAFPVYANLFSLTDSAGERKIEPPFVITRVSEDIKRPIKDEKANHFIVHPVSRDIEFRHPLVTSDSLAIKALNTFQIPIQTAKVGPILDQVSYSIESDTVYRLLLQNSDNFIAEQLLVTASAMLGDTLSTELAIEYMQKEHFIDSPAPFLWVDGSGISRYNMFTPRSLILLLRKMEGQVGLEKLKTLLPVGGVSGTIENWYSGEVPYVFAKTGTVRNNHTLSGYLITQKKRQFVFSLQVNHFPTPSSSVKVEMERLLSMIHENF